VEGIFAQSGIEECEAIVLDGSTGDHSKLYSRFPALRYLRLPERCLVGAERLEGLRLVRAPIVAFLEDHTVPRPGWLAAVREAFEAHPEAAVVNYTVARSPGAAYMFRALQIMQYGHWMEPLESGPIRYACHQNVAYRRDAVLAAAGGNPHLFESEYLVHRRLMDQGWKMWLAGGALIDHENYGTFREGCAGFNALRQVIGAGRAELGGWPRWKRWTWAGGMTLAPPLLMWRLARSLARRPALWGEFLRALPVMFASHVWAAWWEARGYLRGFEDSRERFLAFERYEERSTQAG
jgi:hypothetical protein